MLLNADELTLRFNLPGLKKSLYVRGVIDAEKYSMRLNWPVEKDTVVINGKIETSGVR